MSEPRSERLYNLLPAIYRVRDVEQGAPLRALLAVVEDEVHRLEDDIGELYDNWFIETCEEWVVPYIGDLLGVSAPSDEQHRVISQRARVANTISYRRRKGTAATLERVVFDATGWHARLVEFFRLVAVSQHVQRPRPGQGATVDVRDAGALARVDGPFDSLSRRVDVRPIGASHGRQSATNVGLFVWRLQSYPMSGRAAPASPGSGAYHFHPLGDQLPLFSRPGLAGDPGRSPDPHNLPGAIGLPALADDLAAYRARYAGTPSPLRPADSDYYGPDRGLYIEGVPPLEVICADLGDWQAPDWSQPTGENPRVAVDPRLGRLLFASGAMPQDDVRVRYHYGFSADIGGGPYDRLPTLAAPGPRDWVASVARGADPDPQAIAGSAIFADLQAAVDHWASEGRSGIIHILDNEVYPLDTVALPAGARLVVEAVDGAFPSLRVGPGLRVGSTARGSALALSGLRLDGGIRLAEHVGLDLAHCTVPGGIDVLPEDMGGAAVSVNHSVVGPLRLTATASLVVRDSIVDGRDGQAIAGMDKGPGPIATLERATVFGPAAIGELALASETIFDGRLVVERWQRGGLRFCYVPPESRTPPRYRCQPDLEITARSAEAEGQAAARGKPLSKRQRARIEDSVTAWLLPRFTERAYGAPGYGQLAVDCPPQIAAGAEDGSEMGAFYLLHQSKREANLRAALDEYLPAGLEAGIFYMT